MPEPACKLFATIRGQVVKLGRKRPHRNMRRTIRSFRIPQNSARSNLSITLKPSGSPPELQAPKALDSVRSKRHLVGHSPSPPASHSSRSSSHATSCDRTRRGMSDQPEAPFSTRIFIDRCRLSPQDVSIHERRRGSFSVTGLIAARVDTRRNPIILSDSRVFSKETT